MSAPLDARAELGGWLAAQRELLAGFVRRRAGKLLLRLETAEDLAQGICAHLLERGALPREADEAAQRAWLCTVSERWLADRRDHWSALKRRGGEVLRIAGGGHDSADLAAVRELAASVTGPSTFAVRREQLALAAFALDMLLPRDRALVEGLCAGLDIAEQATALGLGRDATEKARQRALARFRACFEVARRGHGG